jgi:hypothetical protein
MCTIYWRGSRRIEDTMSADKTTNTAAHTAPEAKTVETPFGNWAMPTFENLKNLQNLQSVPGFEAVQKATRQQIDQLENMIDEYAKHEQQALDQARVFMAEMTRLNQASMEYALSLQTEARKLWRAQLHTAAKQVMPQG